MALRYGVLGPLQVLRDGAPLQIGGLKRRAVLAVLVVAGGRVVPVHELLDAVWDGAANDSAEASLQVHISAVRRSLGDDGQLLVHRPPGYALLLGDSTSDLHDFHRLRDEAQDAQTKGDLQAASRAYAAALSLWRGPALADLLELRFAADLSTALDEERVTVLERRIEADLTLRADLGVVGELHALTRTYPLRERLSALLIRALYQQGRQADALEAYADVRRRLLDELGIDPGRELQDLHSRVLAQDPSLLAPPSPAGPQAPAATLRSGVPGEHRGTLVHPGGRLPIDVPRLRIGRDPDGELVLDDPLVSRRHAVVVGTPDGAILIDGGSTNGTKVNGAPVSHHVLRDGDVIEIGGTTLQFVAG